MIIPIINGITIRAKRPKNSYLISTKVGPGVGLAVGVLSTVPVGTPFALIDKLGNSLCKAVSNSANALFAKLTSSLKV